jgi:hypothetical protein
MQRVEQWDIFELSFSGPADGNPFVDVELFATFMQGDHDHRVRGFYDGDGTYRVRFMPDAPGEWEYSTQSNRGTLDGHRGHFTCEPAIGPNHGPVRVANTFHFAYDDGTPYRPVGTTAYAWTHQGEELELQTLETLKGSPFNKIRMCVFPKNYAFNAIEPPRYPFEGTPPQTWDTTRFNPEYFQHFEKRVGQLRDMGIEADIILFHPYDAGRWGFDRMDAESDDRYLRYLIARLGAYRNVWWSLANEYDFMKEKKESDWDRFFQIVTAEDPYGHLRSIHNAFRIYDHNQPWPTHVSLQNGSAVADFGRATLYRDVYNKPIVADEVKYEGNLPQRWGNLSAEEMVHRMWQGAIAGIYTQHGETYLHPDHVIWWARGGKLYGQSPARIAFLRQILESGPGDGIDPIDKWQDLKTAGKAGQYYLVYFGHETPTDWRFELPRQGIGAGLKFKVDVIDTWNMTTEPVPGEFEVTEDATYRYGSVGDRHIKLPGKPFMALRIMYSSGELKKVEEKKIYGEG